MERVCLPSSVTCTLPDGSQQYFSCSPPTLSPAPTTVTGTASLAAIRVENSSTVGETREHTRSDNDDPFWDRRMCAVCQTFMHPQDNHRVCFRCGRCSPLDSCNTCAKWDLKRWKEVSQALETQSRSAPPQPQPSPAPSPYLLHSWQRYPFPTPVPVYWPQPVAPPQGIRRAPCATITSASQLATPSPRPHTPQPQHSPLAPQGRSAESAATTAFTLTQGGSGQCGMRERVSAERMEDESQEKCENVSRAESESENECSEDGDAAHSGERALTRGMVESAWSVMREVLPPNKFHALQAPSSKNRVCASFFEEKDLPPTQRSAYCSSKVQQYKEAFNEELRDQRFAESGFPNVKAIYPSSIPFIRDTPLPLNVENAALPASAAGIIPRGRSLLVTTRDFVRESNLWNEQVAVSSFLELCSQALQRLIALPRIDAQDYKRISTLSNAMVASSSVALMGALRGSTRASFLHRDAVLANAKLPARLKSELRQAELSTPLPFGPKLSEVLTKATSDQLVAHPPPRRYFRPKGYTPFAARSQAPSQATTGRKPRGRGRQQGRQQGRSRVFRRNFPKGTSQ